MQRTILTMNEVGAMLGRSVETLRYWRAKGEGPPSYRVGRRVAYDSDAVRRWLDQQRGAATGDSAA